jgi:hypothetical protein
LLNSDFDASSTTDVIILGSRDDFVLANKRQPQRVIDLVEGFKAPRKRSNRRYHW